MNSVPKGIVLMGPPGSGKSTMALETAVNRPVHVLDLDRKVRSAQRLQPLIESGDVTFWELTETLIEETVKQRIQNLAQNIKSVKKPLGWERFADMIDWLDTKEEAKKAGTWVVDSWTRAAEHAMRNILYWDDRAKSTPSDRDWGSFSTILGESIGILIDKAKSQGKDIIFIVHERPDEIPEDNAKVMRSKDAQGIVRREYIGPMAVKIVPSIAGGYAKNMGKEFEEVYGLKVVVDDRTSDVRWVCRVHPDGKRDLRTSFKVEAAEFECDFRKIWGVK